MYDSWLINDIHTIGMTMQQVQVNTKFLNALPSEWSKFVTDVKLAKSLYTTNYDQLYAYLSQHERHANEVRITLTPQSQAEFSQLDSGLVVPMFQQGEDPIGCINKAMAFLSAVASRFAPSNNQLRISSNPRNQATIQDGRVTVQQVQGRQNQSYAGTENRGIATTSKGNPKRPRNAAWFKEKLMLAEAQEAGQILDEEQLSFLADPDELDAYDLDCDDLSSAKAVLMAYLLSCDPEVLSEFFYDDSHKQDLAYQNPFHLKKAQRIQPTLYDGSVIAKEHAVISVIDDEETIDFEEERSIKVA
ncbi:hypothetical protein Tco_0471329 [Tanacetum coccineum]